MIASEHDPTVLFILGIPGLGKTMVACLLAEARPRSAHIESDSMKNLAAGGAGRRAAGRIDRQLWLRERNAASLADNRAIEGLMAVIDDVLAGIGPTAGFPGSVTISGPARPCN